MSRSTARAPSERAIRTILDRYGCPVPFHEVRTRFLGSIACPVSGVKPMAVLQQLWCGELPPFDNLDDLNELLDVLVMGLWNALTVHQDPKVPFRVVQVPLEPTLANLGNLGTVRAQEIEGNLLPLDRSAIKTVAVIGPMAAQITRGAQYTGMSSSFPSNLDGIRTKLAGATEVIYARGSGVLETDNPETSLREAEEAARKADVAIIFAGTNDKIERETLDRTALILPSVQGELIRRVRVANPRTVLVLQNGGPISLAPTQIEYLTGYIFPGEKSAEAPAMLDMFWAGEEGGNAVADVLFGDYNPAGRLPYTVYRSDTFLQPMNDRDITKGTTYLYFGGTPEYAFGHGLSYSSFAYAGLAVAANRLPGDQLVVQAHVQNTGKRDGDEVVQVYVRSLSSAPVKMPKRQLAAFERVPLKVREKRRLSFAIDPRDLATWDEQAKGWALEAGNYEVMVGSSSSDIHLRAQFQIGKRGKWSDLGQDSPPLLR